MKRCASIALMGVVVLAAAACGDVATLPPAAGMGPQPTLPPPQHTLIPTVHIAPAKGWPNGVTAQAAPGMDVNAFARDLDHPRWLYVLPNGDVLVAETNAPAKPQAAISFKDWLSALVMERAGAGVPSANRITLLRDTDGDGVADLSSVRDGAFYGWPYSYFGQHGSWNRRPHSGYKVIFVPFKDGKPDGLPVDVLTGFLSEQGDAFGRPVGVVIDRQGALLVADDVGNVIWRVQAQPAHSSTH